MRDLDYFVGLWKTFLSRGKQWKYFVICTISYLGSKLLFKPVCLTHLLTDVTVLLIWSIGQLYNFAQKIFIKYKLQCIFLTFWFYSFYLKCVLLIVCPRSLYPNYKVAYCKPSRQDFLDRQYGQEFLLYCRLSLFFCLPFLLSVCPLIVFLFVYLCDFLFCHCFVRIYRNQWKLWCIFLLCTDTSEDEILEAFFSAFLLCSKFKN